MLLFIWGYLKQYWYIGIILIAFIAGWKLSYSHYAVNQLNADLKSAKAVQVQIENTLSTERQINQNFQQKDLQYQQQLYQRDLLSLQQQKDLENDKTYIDSHDVIELKLLRIVGAISTNVTNLSSNATTSRGSGSESKTISNYVDIYAPWALGLRQHDDNCTLQANALIDAYNSEMKLINK